MSLFLLWWIYVRQLRNVTRSTHYRPRDLDSQFHSSSLFLMTNQPVTYDVQNFRGMLLNRLQNMIAIEEIIPHHQFGFRHNHSTIQQCHRIVHQIKDTLEGKKMCASVFLDIQQAFDKVWHQGLLFKLKTIVPSQIYLLLKSYLTDRHFQVNIENTQDITPFNPGYRRVAFLAPSYTWFLLLISPSHKK
jgi:hypothetical protein